MKKNWRLPIISLIAVIFVLVLLSVLGAFTAANTVPNTRADKDSIGTTANQLKPSECDDINLTNIVDIGAGETGTSANDLILGTDKDDEEIRGEAGDDCILGGKGNERQKSGKDWIPGIYGGGGNDVIIGGPGNKDMCDGGTGTDTFYSCETEID